MEKTLWSVDRGALNIGRVLTCVAINVFENFRMERFCGLLTGTSIRAYFSFSDHD